MPFIVGGAFLIISLPFITGSLIPSIHEGGYSSIYAIINFPALLVIGKIGNYVESVLFRDPSLYQSNILFVLMCLLFWMVVSFMIAIFMDKTNKKNV